MTLGHTLLQYSRGGNPIAICEVAMLPMALWYHKHVLRGKQVVWFVDNTVALGAVIKGNARNPVVDRAVALFHFLCFHLQVTVWFEYVDSASNWADSISRELDKSQWTIEQGFQIKQVHIPVSLWQVELPEAWRLIQDWSSVGEEAEQSPYQSSVGERKLGDSTAPSVSAVGHTLLVT